MALAQRRAFQAEGSANTLMTEPGWHQQGAVRYGSARKQTSGRGSDQRQQDTTHPAPQRRM